MGRVAIFGLYPVLCEWLLVKAGIGPYGAKGYALCRLAVA